jgi:myo-inositol-1(or 4)-monophosphatase
MNLELITRQVANLAKAVGHFIKTESSGFSRESVSEKGEHDLVSYVDKESEKRIVGELQKTMPSAGFIAEESPELEEKEEFNWIIDPLDGTTNFVHGIPVYAVSIALKHKDEIVSGVVYEVIRDECFYAWKNGPAYLNDQVISVSATATLNDSLIATGFPYHDYSLMQAYLGIFDDLMRSTRGIRRLGSAAVDLAYVACGRFEMFYEYGLKPWDVAAGVLIVEQAGGKVTDFSGGEDYLFGRRIVASNGSTHDLFMKKIRHYFRDT